MNGILSMAPGDTIQDVLGGVDPQAAAARDEALRAEAARTAHKLVVALRVGPMAASIYQEIR